MQLPNGRAALRSKAVIPEPAHFCHTAILGMLGGTWWREYKIRIRERLSWNKKMDDYKRAQKAET